MNRNVTTNPQNENVSGSSLKTDRRVALRSFGACCAAFATGNGSVCAQNVSTPVENNHRFRGLSLATYSYRKHMNWWKGKPTDGLLDMPGFLRKCAEMGTDAAELTGYFFPHPLETSYISRLKRLAFRLGLDISGGAIGNDFGHPPSSAKGKSEIAQAKRWIDHYGELGAPAVRVFAGRSRPSGSSDEVVIDNVVSCLHEVLPHAEKRGVMLGIENHDFATNLDYLERVVQRVDSDWLGVTWDSANLAPTSTPYEDLAKIAKYAITAQVKVMTRRNGKPIPADYNKLLAILANANYRGYVVLEYEETEDPMSAVPKFVRDVRKTLDAFSRGR